MKLNLKICFSHTKIGIKSIFSIMTGVSTLDEALKEGSRNLELTTENVVRLLK